MSSKTVWWTLVVVLACALILLFNYWAAYQLLSTLAYSGLVLALVGLANVVVPFRFLGIRKRTVGAVVLAGGVALAVAALSWPAPTFHVAQPRKHLDEIMPEYQFYERHATRVHARPDQVIAATRESTFGDMKSLSALLKIRGAVAHIHGKGELSEDLRVLDAFSASGYSCESTEHEIVMFGVGNAKQRPKAQTRQEYANYGEQGAIKMAFDFVAEDEGGGWSRVSTETRVLALGADTRRGMSRYWRLIVPGSGLLRRQWLEAIKKRAESMPATRS